jgi:ligand-binding sensor protein
VLLEELVSREQLQRLETIFSRLFGFTVVFESLRHEIITLAEGEARPMLCRVSELVNSTPEGRSACLACDNEAAHLAMTHRRTVLYRCHAYLNNFAIPIMVGNEVIATLYGGQFAMREPPPEQIAAFNQRLHDLGIMRLGTVSGKYIQRFEFFKGFDEEEARRMAGEVSDRVGLFRTEENQLFRAYIERLDKNIREANDVLSAIEVLMWVADDICVRGGKEVALTAAHRTRALVNRVGAASTRQIRKRLAELDEVVEKLGASAGKGRVIINTERALHLCGSINKSISALMLRRARRALWLRWLPYTFLESARYEEARRCRAELQQLYEQWRRRDSWDDSKRSKKN